MITTTLGALYRARHALTELAQQRMAATELVHALHLLDAAGKEIGLVEAQRVTLVQELGVLSADGKKQEVLEETPAGAAFASRLTEFCAVAVVLPLAPLDFSAGLPKALTLAPAELMLMREAGLVLLPAPPSTPQTREEKSI